VGRVGGGAPGRAFALVRGCCCAARGASCVACARDAAALGAPGAHLVAAANVDLLDGHNLPGLRSGEGRRGGAGVDSRLGAGRRGRRCCRGGVARVAATRPARAAAVPPWRRCAARSGRRARPPRARRPAGRTSLSVALYTLPNVPCPSTVPFTYFSIAAAAAARRGRARRRGWAAAAGAAAARGARRSRSSRPPGLPAEAATPEAALAGSWHLNASPLRSPAAGALGARRSWGGCVLGGTRCGPGSCRRQCRGQLKCAERANAPHKTDPATNQDPTRPGAARCPGTWAHRRGERSRTTMGLPRGGGAPDRREENWARSRTRALPAAPRRRGTAGGRRIPDMGGGRPSSRGAARTGPGVRRAWRPSRPTPRTRQPPPPRATPAPYPGA
jgi:hypothetical protein